MTRYYKKPSKKIKCPDCNRIYSNTQLFNNHKVRDYCMYNAISNSLWHIVWAKRTDLIFRQRKQKIIGNIAAALQRRKLDAACGLVEAPTAYSVDYKETLKNGVLTNRKVVNFKKEFYVDAWVSQLWKKHRKDDNTKLFYKKVEGLLSLPPEEQENAKGMFNLELYGTNIFS